MGNERVYGHRGLGHCKLEALSFGRVEQIAVAATLAADRRALRAPAPTDMHAYMQKHRRRMRHGRGVACKGR